MGETAQWVKHLPTKSEEWSLDLLNIDARTAPRPVVILALDGGDGIPMASLLGRPVAQASCGLEWESLPHLIIRRTMEDDFWHQPQASACARKHTHTLFLTHTCTLHIGRKYMCGRIHTQNIHTHTYTWKWKNNEIKYYVIRFWLFEKNRTQNNPDWPWSPDPPTSVSRVLGLRHMPPHPLSLNSFACDLLLVLAENTVRSSYWEVDKVTSQEISTDVLHWDHFPPTESPPFSLLEPELHQVFLCIETGVKWWLYTEPHLRCWDGQRAWQLCSILLQVTLWPPHTYMYTYRIEKCMAIIKQRNE